MSRRPTPTPPLPEILAELARIATEDLGLRPMLQRVSDALGHYFGWEFVAIVRVDHETRRFYCEALTTALPTEVQVGYSRELGSGVVGEVAVTGKPILVSDARKHANFVHTLPGGQSELCVPILHRGQVIAVLNLESTKVGTFDGSLDLLRTIAEQIAGAIATARRVEELTRRTELLEVVAEFTRQAMESDDLDALLAFVLRSLATRFQTIEATVLLEGDLVGHLEVMAHLGASPHITYRGKQWPVTDGVVGRCFREGLPVFIADVTQEPGYVTVNPDVRTELALPIMMRGRVFGVLNLEAATPTLFQGENRTLLRALADAAGGAIHLLSTAARLQQSQARAMRQAEELGRARENLRRASGKLDRRQGEQAVFGLASDTQFRKRLKAECRAVARGGRALTLWLLGTDPTVQGTSTAHRNEATVLIANHANQHLQDPHPCASRVAPGVVAVVLSGPPGQDQKSRIEDTLQALRQNFRAQGHTLLGRCTSLAATCKLSQSNDPEAFLAAAIEAHAGLKADQHRWLDAHLPH